MVKLILQEALRGFRLSLRRSIMDEESVSVMSLQRCCNTACVNLKESCATFKTCLNESNLAGEIAVTNMPTRGNDPSSDQQA